MGVIFVGNGFTVMVTVVALIGKDVLNWSKTLTNEYVVVTVGETEIGSPP